MGSGTTRIQSNVNVFVTKWIEELDRPYKLKMKVSSTSMLSKIGCVGTPSTSLPPVGTLEWSIDPSWKKQGTHFYLTQMSEIDF